MQLFPWQVEPALRPLHELLLLLRQLPLHEPKKLKNDMIRPWNSPPPQQPLQLLPWQLVLSDCDRVSDRQPLPPAKSRKNPLNWVASGAVAKAVIITSVYIGIVLCSRRTQSSMFDTLGDLCRRCRKSKRADTASQKDLK